MKKKVENKTVTARLSPVKFGLACGIVAALCVLFTTLAGVYGWFGGLTLWNLLLADVYGSFGYVRSVGGAFLGAVYGFIDTFIGAFVLAWIYNKLI